MRRLMSIIDSEYRPVWGDSDDPPEHDPRPSLADSEEEHRRLMENAARQMGDAQAAAMARDRRRGFPLVQRRPGPQLLPADAPRVTLMAADLFRETRGRERFSAFPDGEFSAAAGILVRYRIRSLEISRQTQKDARTMFLRDLVACF